MDNRIDRSYFHGEWRECNGQHVLISGRLMSVGPYSPSFQNRGDKTVEQWGPIPTTNPAHVIVHVSAGSVRIAPDGTKHGPAPSVSVSVQSPQAHGCAFSRHVVTLDLEHETDALPTMDDARRAFELITPYLDQAVRLAVEIGPEIQAEREKASAVHRKYDSPLSREAYCEACAEYGVEPMADDAIAGSYYVKFFQVFPPEYSVERSIEHRLANLRWRAIDRQQQAEDEARAAARQSAVEYHPTTCYSCGRAIERELAMSGSLGTLCPECYDRVESEL